MLRLLFIFTLILSGRAHADTKPLNVKLATTYAAKQQGNKFREAANSWYESFGSLANFNFSLFIPPGFNQPSANMSAEAYQFAYVAAAKDDPNFVYALRDYAASRNAGTLPEPALLANAATNLSTESLLALPESFVGKFLREYLLNLFYKADAETLENQLAPLIESHVPADYLSEFAYGRLFVMSSSDKPLDLRKIRILIKWYNGDLSNISCGFATLSHFPLMKKHIDKENSEYKQTLHLLLTKATQKKSYQDECHQQHVDDLSFIKDELALILKDPLENQGEVRKLHECNLGAIREAVEKEVIYLESFQPANGYVFGQNFIEAGCHFTFAFENKDGHNFKLITRVRTTSKVILEETFRRPRLVEIQSHLRELLSP